MKLEPEALSVLWKYYEDFEDFVPGADQFADSERREKLTAWYEHGMHLTPKERKSLNLSLKKAKRPLLLLLENYFSLDEEDPVIDFRTICNRMGFWMATGSGKTIVLVKLLELLHHLMRREEIPQNDILMLTHREDLLEQFQKCVHEFNSAPDAPVVPGFYRPPATAAGHPRCLREVGVRAFGLRHAPGNDGRRTHRRLHAQRRPPDRRMARLRRSVIPQRNINVAACQGRFLPPPCPLATHSTSCQHPPIVTDQNFATACHCLRTWRSRHLHDAARFGTWNDRVVRSGDEIQIPCVSLEAHADLPNHRFTNY